MNFRKTVAWMVIIAYATLNLEAAKIAEIKFEQSGANPLAEEQLYFNLKARAGDEYNSKIVDNDVKRLFNTGQFADVVAQRIENSDGSLNLVFTMRTQPRVAKITFDGNAKFKDDDLKKLLSLEIDDPMNDAKLRESLSAIREFYKDKGYNDATVAPKLVSIDSDNLEVVINIAEHLRLRVDNVTFDGSTVYSDSKLKGSIANSYSFVGDLPWLGKYFSMGLLDRNELELDKSRIRDLYWQKGYLDFKVEDIKLSPNPDDAEKINIEFILFEGKPYTVKDVKISGAVDVPLGEIEPMVALVADKEFELNRENISIESIRKFYESMGYTDVNVQAIRTPDYENSSVDIELKITEGRKYTVRDVVISGNRYTKDHVIRRELILQPGDPVDTNRIDASKSRLMGMGYFNKVEATTINADDLTQKDVQINVEEKDDRFNAKIGAGVSDMSSFVGMAEISSNNFDIADPGNWFYGGGQRMRLQGIFGVDTFGYSVDFIEPWLFNEQIRFDFSFYGNETEYDYWTERRFGVRSALTHKIFDDFTSITGAYKFEYVDVRDMDDELGPETLNEEGHQWVSQLSLMIDRDTRDSLMTPTEGYNVNLLGAVSPEAMGSTTNFYRLEFKGSYYQPFFDKAIVAMVGLRAGVVSGTSKDTPAPIFERYFLGGGDSLRGFAYRDVAPLDSNGKPIGGNTMLLGTVEVTHPIWSFIRGAVFVDAGSVWSESYRFDFSDMNVGAGYGLRIQLPVVNAPIKLDLAYPIVNNQDNVDSKLRFHFNMGFTW